MRKGDLIPVMSSKRAAITYTGCISGHREERVGGTFSRLNMENMRLVVTHLYGISRDTLQIFITVNKECHLVFTVWLRALRYGLIELPCMHTLVVEAELSQSSAVALLGCPASD